MYIQPERENREPISIPRNYSGNAFRQIPSEKPPPPEPLPQVSPEPREEPSPTPERITQGVAENERADPPPLDAESVPTGAFHGEKPHGLRGRFPFLSSLLPPARGEHKKGGVLPEWALIGAVILLFLWEDEENDILPFLLLLLLWD